LQRALIGIPDGGGDLESIASPPPPWGAKNATPGGLKPLLASKTSVGSLNPSQRAAVNAALSRTLTTWQGPPGTGKTRTLMAFIESVVAVAAARGVLKRGGGDDGKAGGGPVVLACAASNVAVDNIVEGLVRPPGGGKGSGGMRVVRLGSPAKVQPWLLATTLGAQARPVPTLVPVRPRWRGERRFLRTLLPGVSLRPGSLAFNARPRCVSTPSDAPPNSLAGGAHDAWEESRGAATRRARGPLLARHRGSQASLRARESRERARAVPRGRRLRDVRRRGRGPAGPVPLRPRARRRGGAGDGARLRRAALCGNQIFNPTSMCA